MLILGACFTTDKKHYYQIYYNPASGTNEPFKATVRVKTFDIDKVYKKYNIVYRTSPYELFYYNTHLWASRPEDMMTDIMLRHLKASNLFEEIIAKLDKEPTYTVTGTITALDQIDATDKWFARAAMTFSLTDYKTGAVLVSHSFESRKEVSADDPVLVVRALGELIEIETNKFLEKITDELAKRKMSNELPKED